MHYLTFNKFHRLMRGKLSFTRVTKLIETGNMDEAYHTPSTIKMLKEMYDDDIKLINNTITNGKKLDKKLFSYENRQKMVNDICYVSAWTKDSKESKRMWKKYAPHGLVIKSTVEKLEQATINNRFKVYCKDAIYIPDDTIQFPEPLFRSHIIKSIKESIEDNEFRALLVAEHQGNYIDIDVNLSDLITDVRVSRNNDPQVLEVVQKLLDNNNVNVNSIWSTIT